MMRYVEFKKKIHDELLKHPEGLTWKELKTILELPYERPCPNWTKRLEQEIGLIRVKGKGRAYLWKISKT
ncbi:MAG: hypothetical protein PWQ79_739 [Thermococcaceae archaeon]|nr:hypothetical protein [Thermococcaceae archaeon]MDK2913824.1 hypothetical protein [Thermococcaceae archaeon]